MFTIDSTLVMSSSRIQRNRDVSRLLGEGHMHVWSGRGDDGVAGRIGAKEHSHKRDRPREKKRNRRDRTKGH